MTSLVIYGIIGGIGVLIYEYYECVKSSKATHSFSENVKCAFKRLFPISIKKSSSVTVDKGWDDIIGGAPGITTVNTKNGSSTFSYKGPGIKNDPCLPKEFSVNDGEKVLLQKVIDICRKAHKK